MKHGNMKTLSTDCKQNHGNVGTFQICIHWKMDRQMIIINDEQFSGLLLCNVLEHVLALWFNIK